MIGAMHGKGVVHWPVDTQTVPWAQAPQVTVPPQESSQVPQTAPSEVQVLGVQPPSETWVHWPEPLHEPAVQAPHCSVFPHPSGQFPHW